MEFKSTLDCKNIKVTSTDVTFLAFGVMLIICSLFYTGCTKKSEAAKNKLSELNIKFTPENFLNSAKNGETKIVELFLQAGMNVNTKNEEGQTALMLASYAGHIDTVRVLLKHNADINVVDKFGDSALSWAAAEKHTNIVNLLKRTNITKSY